MNKKETETIINTIEFLLDIRIEKTINYLCDKDATAYEKLYAKNIRKSLNREYQDNGLMTVLKTLSEEDFISDIELHKEIDNHLIKLNNLLQEKEQRKEIINLAQEMEKIQAKNILNPKHFFEKYNISISRQRDFRTRLNDPLPYHQMVHRGSISYYVNEVDKWLESNNKH